MSFHSTSCSSLIRRKPIEGELVLPEKKVSFIPSNEFRRLPSSKVADGMKLYQALETLTE